MASKPWLYGAWTCASEAISKGPLRANGGGEEALIGAVEKNGK